MNRREFLLSSLAAPLAAAERPPNIVILLADDLGYGDLACYGSRTNETPNLDRMAGEGVRFTDCYVPMPYCAPSRATLLTGRYPFRHGMWSNPAPDSGINIGLASSEITLAEALKPKGYASICIGKWHLGHTPEYLPRTQGFDEYYGILYSNDMRPVQIVHNEKVVAVSRGAGQPDARLHQSCARLHGAQPIEAVPAVSAACHAAQASGRIGGLLPAR